MESQKLLAVFLCLWLSLSDGPSPRLANNPNHLGSEVLPLLCQCCSQYPLLQGPVPEEEHRSSPRSDVLVTPPPLWSPSFGFVPQDTVPVLPQIIYCTRRPEGNTDCRRDLERIQCTGLNLCYSIAHTFPFEGRLEVDVLLSRINIYLGSWV